MKKDRLEELMAISRNRYELQITADWRYEQFFNFLQVSPSYRLAHLIATAKVDKLAVKRPKDFAVVEKTYEAFGDVWEIVFWTWWIKRAQYQFGISVTPTVHAIATVQVGAEVSKDAVAKAQDELEQYLLADRLAEGKPASLIVAVPLHGDRRKILNQFSEMLDKFYKPTEHQCGIAHYQVNRNKIREQTLKNARRVLRARAALPKKPLFVIGNKSKIAPAYETDEKKPLRNDECRRLMEILTSRQLHRAYLYAEHAARGNFPCLDPLPKDNKRPDFNYISLHRQLKAQIRWLASEIAKFDRVDAVRKAKNM